MASLRHTLSAGALVLVALGTAACTGGQQPVPSESVVVPDPTPTPTAMPFLVPEATEGEVARSEHSVVDGTPSTSSASVDIARSDTPLIVEGQCAGEGVASFRLLNANVGAGSAQLAAGEIRCSAPSLLTQSYDLGFEGVIQLSVSVPEGSERAWVVVRQE